MNMPYNIFCGLFRNVMPYLDSLLIVCQRLVYWFYLPVGCLGLRLIFFTGVFLLLLVCGFYTVGRSSFFVFACAFLLKFCFFYELIAKLEQVVWTC